LLAHWGTWKAQLSGRLAIPLSAPPFLSTHDNGQTTTHANNVTKNLAADALCASPSLLLRNRSFLTWKSYEYNIANRIPKAQLAFQSAVAPPSLGFLAFCLSTPISTPTQTALAKVVARTRSRRQQKKPASNRPYGHPLHRSVLAENACETPASRSRQHHLKAHPGPFNHNVLSSQVRVCTLSCWLS